ncbi:hypothetical protein [Streptosporangium sp. NPDC000396]|uniref:hypothetical protein n=1 Tax=Streptosporangium sp. NPDC000396 TaxID=3366185 RepID=UPI0036A490D7
MTPLVPLVPLPESRDELPQDAAGLPTIDRRFDLVAVCRTMMTDAAAELSSGMAHARVGNGYVSWDSLSDATAAAELIHLMTSALPIMYRLEATDGELDAFPASLHHLCIDLESCPNLGSALE